MQWTLGAPTLASSDANGVLGNGFSLQANLSPDGTRVLFWSRSTNLVTAAANGLEQLFLKDLTTGVISVVSADANGVAGNGTTSDPSNAGQILLFSPDGTKVVFESSASNLIPSGTNGHQHIFLKDLTNGSVTLVSKDANGIQGNGFSLDFCFSPDGTKVAFDSTSTNLIVAGTTGQQVFVKDLSSGVVTLASADGNGGMGNGSSSFPVFSPDSAEVAFISTSTNFVAGATNGHSEIYVKNLQTGAVTLESADALGNEANTDSLYPMFSPDGSRLLFNSVSTNLVPNLPAVNSEVYVKDLASGAITLISTDASGAPANGSTSMLGVFSADATKIAFQSQSTNLASGANGAAQVFIKDLLTGAITLASTSSSGVIGNSNSIAPNLSPGHTALAFESSAMNFGVNSFTSQVYTRAIFAASGAVADDPSASILTTAGQLAFSDPDTSDTHTASVVAQAGDLGTVTATVSKDSSGTGTGGVVLWNYQVDESQLSALTAPVTDNFTLTLTDSQGCIATTALVVTALPHDFRITNASSGSASASTSTSTSSCPTLSITTSPSSLTVVAGQTVSFNAAAIGSPSPTVQWQRSTDGGKTFSNDPDPSATSATLTFTASMSQNGNLYRAAFTNSSGTVMSTSATLTVNMAQSAAALASSSKGSSVFGQALSFTVTVTALAPGAGTPTGAVTFSDGNANLGTATLDSTGAASFTTSALAVGTHSITAAYAGDSNFSPSSSSLSQTVSKDSATVTLGSSANQTVFGQAVNFTVTVTAAAPGAGTPTGMIAFSDGNASLGTATLDSTGAATFPTSSLAVGTHSITAAYAGDSNFNPSSSSLSQTVSKDSTTVMLGSSMNPSAFGQAVNFTVTVTAAAPGAGTPTGTIAFSDGNASIGTAMLDSTGAASFNTSSLAVGTHSITAAYGGEGNFNSSSSSTLSQVVNKNNATVALNSSADPSVFGQAVNLTVTVTASAPGTAAATGTVTLQDGSATPSTLTLVNGQASFSTASLAVGSHSITAAYSGDSNLNAASSSLAQTVNRDATLLTLGSSANPSVFGQSVVVTAMVSAAAPGAGTPSGTIAFQDGGTSLGSANLNSGQAFLTLSALSIGGHSITATYSGDANFASSTDPVTQTVNKASTTTTLSSSAGLATLNQSVTFTATVNVVAPGAGTPMGSVTFSDGTSALATVSLSSNGTATFTTSSLAVKSHSITAGYSGDVNFNGSSGVLTQNVQYGLCMQYDQTRSVQSGATFPIKLQLCDFKGNNLSSSSIVIHATAVTSVSGYSGPPQDSGNANPDNDFRFSGGTGQNAGYIFNLSTNGLQTGTYALQFTVSGDPIPHSVLFGVQ